MSIAQAIVELGRAEAKAEIARLRAALQRIADVPTCPGAEREYIIKTAREALYAGDK